jgi:hypothetical protein
MAKLGIDFDPNPLTIDRMVRNVIAGTLVTMVEAIFDDSGNSLPLDTSIPVDGYTIQNNDKVYVKDSATPGQINGIYVATVTGTTIVW